MNESKKCLYYVCTGYILFCALLTVICTFSILQSDQSIALNNKSEKVEESSTAHYHTKPYTLHKYR